jgi:uncharacterized protein YfdQ (DUF2303 family)
MDRHTLDTICTLAIQAERARHLDADTPAIILTNGSGGETIQSIEHLQPGRSRYRGKFLTTKLGAFTDHVKQSAKHGNAQAKAFVDADNAHAIAYFNLGDHEHPGHGDHTAHLQLKPTAAYDVLCQMTKRPMTQRQLHDFVEDWRDIIDPVYDGTPDPKRMASALAAIRDITVAEARNTTHVERDMGASRSAMESVDAKSSHTLPSGFYFRTAPYEGLPVRTFRLRLGVVTGDDKLTLTLRIQQAEQVFEEITHDLCHELATRLGDASSLTVGTFTP